MSSIPMGFSPQSKYNNKRRNNIIVILCFLSVLIFPCGVLAQTETDTSNRINNDNNNNINSSYNNCPTPCICKGTDNGGSDEISSVTCSSHNLTNVPIGLPTTTRKLELERNLISKIDPNALLLLGSLKELSLSRNLLTHVPHDAILPQLQILNLAHNHIRRLNNHILKNNSKLHALILSNNIIEDIDEEAFVGLGGLYILELNDNRLTQIPTGLAKLTNLHELNLANNHIVEIATPFNKFLSKIVLLELKGNPFHWIHADAFAHLRHLKKLILSDVKNFTVFPHLNGTSALEILRIDRCSLNVIPHHLCSLSPKLKSLDLKSNKIEKFPSFQGCSELKILDVGSNEIQELEEGGFQELSQLHDLHLSHNLISRIPAGAFHGLSQLRALDLSYNNIDDIHPDSFLPTPQLEDLNLGNNYFSTFPSTEFSAMAHLKIANNPNLREFPGPESFPSVRTMVLSFAYHCCQFTSYGLKSSSLEPPIQESVFYPTDKEFDSALSNLNLAAELWPGFGNFSNNGLMSSQDFWKNLETFAPSEGSMMEDDQNMFTKDLSIPRRDIQCIPLPGPFLPCNDLFDWWTLRCGVWVVFLLALMGNGTVVFVLIFARTKMDVPRFLVCNLAIADFFMGVYLGFLAVVDAATLGEFRRFAIPWQLSRGCQMAGFLGVLSSELSVYTLAVITMERHYAITHAMHLNKRLSLRHASYIMIIGWIFAMFMAILPLFGVSDYRKFAVCLPFETGDAVSMSYVVFLMFANGVAFTILMGCYLKMYCSIRGSQAWNSNDTRIAKRMALLVFTDLLCWFPIAFFSLTAVFGLQLVSLEEAKVFTVFILPLNSCCNPFLYAILTKQFKKDCVLICKAIEESRVTRGIGRCRHSSNFSNRQTAANTGSLVEKSSKDGQPCICHAGLHPTGEDVNGNAKYRFIPSSERWSRYGPLGRFFSRYILCQNNSKEANRKARDDYRMRNVRRFLYNSTPGNYPPDAQKHKRHASVSSDNFSSSRSDSWRVQGRCGLPSRLLEPRRRNSWAVTRKPSQDSNLSSSRNDSSATSNSTATWRLSRSSVSSDAASHSGGGKSSLKRIAAATASTHNYGNIVAARAAATVAASTINSTTTNNSSGGSAAVPGGNATKSKITNFPKDTSSTTSTILLPNVQQQQEEPLLEMSRHCQKASQNKKQSATRMGEKSSNSTKKVAIVDDGIIDDDELSAKIATNRPRLVRQSAFFSDEVVIEPEICPVHGVLIPGTYDNEEEDQVSDIDELDEEEDDDEGLGDPTSPILRKPNANPYSIALVIVPPRRLSTISSSRDSAAPAPSISEEEQRSGSPSSGIVGSVTTTGVVAMLASSSSSPGTVVGQQQQFQFAGETGRRKMSEQQPVNLYFLPSSVVGNKWHSMSSVEVMETQPQLHVVTQSTTQSSPQSSSGDQNNSASRNVNESGSSNNDTQTAGASTTNNKDKDQQERRVSFQLPPQSATPSTSKSVASTSNIVNPPAPRQ